MCGKQRFPGLQIDRGGGSVVFGGLQKVRLLTVIELQCLHVVKRETAQVNLPVLGIAQLDSVIENACVVCAERTDVHGFQSTDSAIILYLHPS